MIEERDVGKTVAISNTDDQTIRFFLSQQVISEKVKDGLQQAMALKAKVAATQQEIRQQERR